MYNHYKIISQFQHEVRIAVWGMIKLKCQIYHWHHSNNTEIIKRDDFIKINAILSEKGRTDDRLTIKYTMATTLNNE